MTDSHSSRLFIWFYVYLTLVVVTVVTHDVKIKEGCDRMKCLGPLSFYDDLNCTPVYEKDDDCCAVKYNCSNLKNISRKKCYLNGHEYKVGEVIRPEDENPCEAYCVCVKRGAFADFYCVNKTCPHGFDKDDPFYPSKHPLECCPSRNMTYQYGEYITTCEIDGAIYPAGWVFSPVNKPDYFCICLPGFKGEIVEPYCSKSNRRFGSNVHAVNRFLRNCPPVYPIDNEGNRRIALNGIIATWTCEKYKGGLIAQIYDMALARKYLTADYARCMGITKLDNTPIKKSEDVCLIRNYKMYILEEIILQLPCATYACFKCICEVPPVPTCFLVEQSECNFLSWSDCFIPEEEQDAFTSRFIKLTWYKWYQNQVYIMKYGGCVNSGNRTVFFDRRILN